MVKRKNKDVEDGEEVEGGEETPEAPEIPDPPEGSTVDTNAGPDAISGTIADQEAEGTAPYSHAGDPVDTNAGK